MDQKAQDRDQPVLSHIQQLVEEEHRLYERGEHSALADAERHKLEKVQVELDRCWDLLRQRRALRGGGSRSRPGTGETGPRSRELRTVADLTSSGPDAFCKVMRSTLCRG